MAAIPKLLRQANVQSGGHQIEDKAVEGLVSLVFFVAVWAWKSITKDLRSTRSFVEVEMKKTRSHIDTSLKVNAHNNVSLQLKILRRLLPEKAQQIDDMEAIRIHEDEPARREMH